MDEDRQRDIIRAYKIGRLNREEAIDELPHFDPNLIEPVLEILLSAVTRLNVVEINKSRSDMELIIQNINAIGFLITILLLIAILRSRRSGKSIDTGNLRDFNALSAELSSSKETAGRASALAEERKAEIDRLNGDLSKITIEN